MKKLLSSVLISSALFSTAVMAQDVAALEKAARAEGEVNSVGMPDSWA
ncbi:ABC transporter substrate-binding protein, partial [Pectobacterium versatile]|nr:ABC transporter substrate-binding protein [Pectobacterium versatile]